ncbi:MAG: HAMP domain-containing sensor histidine kinase [Candidatus Nanopelagicales bacterium]
MAGVVMARRARRRIAEQVAGLPLRSRLVGLLLALVAAALLLAGFAAVTALRGYLIGEVDRGLTSIATAMADPGGPAPPPRDDGLGPLEHGREGQDLTYVRVSNAAGTEHEATAASETITDPPQLRDMSVTAAAELDGQAYVVDSQSGASRWRVVTLPLADGSGSVTVAQDIGAIDATVGRLALIELGIGIAVLATLGVAGWLLVRRSLRPLDDVAHAAAVIAAGDLSHRAPTAHPRTEVGSLAASFNTMVDTLQGAFAAQQASERMARESAAAAQESEGRMRQFIADASHELRTPLTSVRGFAELYRIGAVPPGAALDDAMGRIEAEASRMGVLVDDLLLLARLDQQRPLDRSPVDLVDLVTDAVAAARAGSPERDLRIGIDPDADEPIVVGDAVRLRQVIDNLLSNAIRYSPADQPIVARVGLTDEAGRRWAEVQVIDRGPGMAPDVASRVFERFYRADRARSRELGGTGLGLAIVAAITSAHGGLVQVASQPGHGSAFRILLPAMVEPESQPPGVRPGGYQRPAAG